MRASLPQRGQGSAAAAYGRVEGSHGIFARIAVHRTRTRPRAPSPQSGHTIAMRRLRVGLAQVNPTVGDTDGNTTRVLDRLHPPVGPGRDPVPLPHLSPPRSPPPPPPPPSPHPPHPLPP